MTTMAIDDLHDFTLFGLAVDWEAKRAAFDLRGPIGVRTLTVKGLRQLELTRDDPWGPSASVNKVTVHRKDGGAELRVIIEMQSGDEIRLTCAEVG